MNKIIVGFLVACLNLSAIAVSAQQITRDRDRSAATELVDSAIDAYRVYGEEVFAQINDADNEFWHTNNGRQYLFIIEVATGKIVAPTAHWEREIKESERKFVSYLIAVANENPQGAWVTYDLENPNTRTVQFKHSFIKAHQGYVFGSGNFYTRLMAM